MKQPTEADLDIEIRDADEPLLVSIAAKRRKVSARANVRHVKTGDAGDYASGDIEALAFRLACVAIKRLQH